MKARSIRFQKVLSVISMLKLKSLTSSKNFCYCSRILEYILKILNVIHVKTETGTQKIKFNIFLMEHKKQNCSIFEQIA